MGQARPEAAPHPPSFSRALISNIAGLVLTVGVALLIAMIWHGIVSTGKAAQQEITATLDRATERLRILVQAAEMTAESAERAARNPTVTSTTLRSTLERSLAAFEQRPELSYLGIVLPETGEYGNLERTDDGTILLWLFPGTRIEDPFTRNFILTDHGFLPHTEFPTSGYDPRRRPFYQAALNDTGEGIWMPSYEWIVHTDGSEPLWGLSYMKALRDDGGHLVSVLDADFDIPALNAFLQSLAADYGTGFQIVELGETPRLIGSPQAKRSPLPLPHELAPLLAFTGDTFVDRMTLEGERRWVAARRLSLKGGISWLIVASRKDALIEAPLRRQLYQVIGMGLAIMAGLVLVSARMARRLGKPLAALEQRVTGIARHEPSPQAPTASLTAASDDFHETRLLGAAFDRMAIAIRERERELAAQHRELLAAKEQQVASLALKAAIFDSTGTAIFSIDRRMDVIEWNAAAERLFGRERAQILGRPVSAAVHAPDGPAPWATILTASGSGIFRLSGAGGAFDAEVLRITLNQHGHEIRTLFINDISERKRAEAALRESLARFHAAARATGDVVWDWDLTTDTIWWNENFQILFGYSASDIEPTIESWNRRLHPQDRERVIAHIHAVIDDHEETWVDEYRFRRKDGTYAYVFDRGQVLRDASGRSVRMIGALQDITERKKAHAQLLVFNAELEQRVALRTQELQTLNKELETFCYSVSHDLRAPLRGIAGFAEILTRNHAGALDDTARNYLGRINTATHRMDQLIDDLLELSRVSREEMRSEPVDLSAIAREILAQLRQRAPEREVETFVEDGLRTVGDARLLRIALENLLGNAWKFTSGTSAARISFTAAGAEHGADAFAVSDNGAGFDMRYADKLFGPFQRLHRATEFPGTGIGLATVQRIVSRHGARISASAEPGKGATFILAFNGRATS